MGFSPAPSYGGGGSSPAVGSDFLDLTGESWAGGIEADLTGLSTATVTIGLPDAPAGTEDLTILLPSAATSEPFTAILASAGTVPLLLNVGYSGGTASHPENIGVHEPTTANVMLDFSPVEAAGDKWLCIARPYLARGNLYGAKLYDRTGDAFPMSQSIAGADTLYATIGLAVPAADPGDTLEITAMPDPSVSGHFILFMLSDFGDAPQGPEFIWPAEVAGGVSNPYGLAVDAAVQVYMCFPTFDTAWGVQRLPASETPGLAVGVGYDDTGNTYVTGATVAAALAATEVKFVDLESRVATLEP